MTTGAVRPQGRRFSSRRKACWFCVQKVNQIDYKAAGRLRRFVSDRSRIDSGKKSGNCARHQRMVRTALKRARYLALIPYDQNHVSVTSSVSKGETAKSAAISGPEHESDTDNDEQVDQVDSEASSDNVNESIQDAKQASVADTDLSVSVAKEETKKILEQNPENTSSAVSEEASTMEDSSDAETPETPEDSPTNRSSSGVSDVEEEEQ